MLISLYNTNDSNMIINKTLTNKVDYDIKIKDNVSIINPVIILKNETLITSNYAYIPNFNRYYYIDDIEVFPNDVYNLSLKCDVLMSFKNDILNSNAYINQSTNDNKYYDSGFRSEVKKEVDIYYSDFDMSNEETSIILITVGG